jgi:DNA repair photolyase
MSNSEGVPSPGFARRIGDVVDRRRGVVFRDLASRSLVNRLSGSGMPFGWTVNPFRGCELGCRYCYARPTHEYLGHVDPAEFEDRIYVKSADTSALVADLKRARDSGQEIAVGTATDPYQPAETRFGVTRGVLEAMLRVPGLRIGLTTKASGLLRDIDLLARLARVSDLWLNVSLISLDAELLRLIEPRAPRPDRRLLAMRAAVDAGVRARIFVMPVLPLITDGEASLRELLRAARGAGAEEAICQPLFLRTAMVRDLFLDFVRRELPWALPRYLEMFPRPGSAPRPYREAIERRVERLAREAGFSARSREERVADEAPARPRQLALVW